MKKQICLTNEFISIVIPTFNRGKTLLEVLSSYLCQQYVKEIIIVDDFSNDDTEALIKKYALTHLKINYIKNNHRQGTNETTNIGLKKAIGDYIFIGEDDVELNDNYLEILLKHLKKENADIISGRRIAIRINESKYDALMRANKSKGLLINNKTLVTNFEILTENDASLYLLDACMLLRRDVINSVQFDTKLIRDPVAWRGESDFQLSAIEHGFKLIFCPHAYCFHLPKKKESSFQIIKYIKYDHYVFKNNYLFLRKHKKFINNNLKINSIFFIFQFGFFRIINRYFLPLFTKIKIVLSGKHST